MLNKAYRKIHIFFTPYFCYHTFINVIIYSCGYHRARIKK